MTVNGHDLCRFWAEDRVRHVTENGVQVCIPNCETPNQPPSSGPGVLAVRLWPTLPACQSKHGGCCLTQDHLTVICLISRALWTHFHGTLYSKVIIWWFFFFLLKCNVTSDFTIFPITNLLGEFTVDWLHTWDFQPLSPCHHSLYVDGGKSCLYFFQTFLKLGASIRLNCETTRNKAGTRASGKVVFLPACLPWTQTLWPELCLPPSRSGVQLNPCRSCFRWCDKCAFFLRILMTCHITE